jgi:hypothetical protein
MIRSKKIKSSGSIKYTPVNIFVIESNNQLQRFFFANHLLIFVLALSIFKILAGSALGLGTD